MLLELQTVKGKSFDEHLKLIEKIISEDSSLGGRIKSFLVKEMKFSVFVLNDKTTNQKLIAIVLVCIILADIATIPSQVAREPYLKIIDKINSSFGINPFDISVLSRFTSTFEELISEAHKVN